MGLTHSAVIREKFRAYALQMPTVFHQGNQTDSDDITNPKATSRTCSLSCSFSNGGLSGASHGIGERVGRAQISRQADSLQALLAEPRTWM